MSAFLARAHAAALWRGAGEEPAPDTGAPVDPDRFLRRAPLDETTTDRRSAFTTAGAPGVTFTTPFEICLHPFLEALGWKGEDRRIVEALPHLDQIADLETFRAVLGNLGYASRTHRLQPHQVSEDQLPAIMMLGKDRPVLLLARDGPGAGVVFDPATTDFRRMTLPVTRMRICFATPRQDQAGASQQARISWFTEAAYSFRRPILTIFGLTFAVNVLALATPLYVMNVYNLVIGAKSFATLPFFVLCVGMVLGLELYLKRKRGRITALIGARLSAGLKNAGLGRLLGLPLAMTESAPISAQIMRLKQFEGVHGFFVGPVATACLDLPFVLLFFIAIAVIAPPLALAPVVLAAIFAVMALVAVPGTRKRFANLNAATAASQDFLTDAISKKDSVNQLRAEGDWRRRFVQVSRDLALRRFQVNFFEAMLGGLAQSLVMLAGVATLLVGAQMVMAQDLSVGALVAVMMLIWRVLAPIQTAFTSLNRIGQFVDSVRQINILMRIPLESQERPRAQIRRSFRGRVTFNGVAFRYGPDRDPVFRGLNLDIPAGQFVCLTGAAAGRSTLLKLALGLHRPQAGAVFLDGLNLQQLDPAEVRSSIAYLPASPTLFYGTVAQNMRMAEPTASDADILTALEEAGLDIAGPMFPDGVETRLTAERLATLPKGALQGLSLARTWCKRSALYLLNMPSSNLDGASEQALLRKLGHLKGRATVILVSSRDSHMQMSDRVIRMDRGEIAADGPPAAPPASGQLQ